MTVLDVSKLLLAPPSEGTEPHALGGGLDAQWSLLQIATGDRWESGLLIRGVEVLVLEGTPTGSLAGARETLGSGHLVVVPAGGDLRLDNDGRDTVRALLRVPLAGPELHTTQDSP